MKVVVIGGTGLIGSKLIKKLGTQGINAIAASPSKGVNTMTGEGLDKALQGVDVVVDVSNPPSFDENIVVPFFETAQKNLAKAEKLAHVKHHIALSVVGTGGLQQSAYFKGKLIQENLIKQSSIPYTILQATQFFEFLGSIAESGLIDDEIHLPAAYFQPVAADDVVSLLAELVQSKPINNTIELAGPEKFRMYELIEKYLQSQNNYRLVQKDEKATYFGTPITDQSLTPSSTNPRLGIISIEEWLKQKN